MPLPMVHISVALQMHRIKNTKPSPYFLLGSIAPDSIHMRTNATREDKNATHLFDSDSNILIQNVNNLLENYDTASKNENFTDFLEGYCAHILTDFHWKDMVYNNFKAGLVDNLSPQELRTLYYQETDQIDFNIYKTAPWRSKVWEQLSETETFDFKNLLSAEEILKWRDRTLDWFDKIKKEPGITPECITDSMAEEFVNDSAGLISKQFYEWNTIYSLKCSK